MAFQRQLPVGRHAEDGTSQAAREIVNAQRGRVQVSGRVGLTTGERHRVLQHLNRVSALVIGHAPRCRKPLVHDGHGVELAQQIRLQEHGLTERESVVVDVGLTRTYRSSAWNNWSLT